MKFQWALIRNPLKIIPFFKYQTHFFSDGFWHRSLRVGQSDHYSAQNTRILKWHADFDVFGYLVYRMRLNRAWQYRSPRHNRFQHRSHIASCKELADFRFSSLVTVILTGKESYRIGMRARGWGCRCSNRSQVLIHARGLALWFRGLCFPDSMVVF